VGAQVALARRQLAASSQATLELFPVSVVAATLSDLRAAAGQSRAGQ